MQLTSTSEDCCGELDGYPRSLIGSSSVEAVGERGGLTALSSGSDVGDDAPELSAEGEADTYVTDVDALGADTHVTDEGALEADAVRGGTEAGVGPEGDGALEGPGIGHCTGWWFFKNV